MGDDLNSSETVRVRGISLSKAFIFGSYSQLLTKKRESDSHTHDWTVYVKPFFNEDMSSFVKKVQFKLHDTYDTPVR
jgi:YEATS domain-containing protein 4